ncbi:hypothetical protein [Serinicoccus kebangsaanensis]|uniref:hypothetical protein n=1 Tax=Serinicoccus kebangsaanensis TaxID=2602069 RepID=UPI00124CE0D7|nr:hypothetical protein [Serinicoccus kebangsaanensis]
METLFRFNIVREPNRTPDESDPIDLTAESEFQSACAAIPNGDTRHDQLRALAAKYATSAKFVGDIAGNATTAGLDAASTAIDELLANNDAPSRSDVETALTDALGGDPAAYLDRAGLPALEVRVKDSILAIKLSAAHHKLPIRRLGAVLRALEFLRRYAAKPAFPESREDLVAAARRGLRVPGHALPTRPPTPPRATPPDLSEKLKDLVSRHTAIDAAIGELRAIRPDGFATVGVREHPALMPDPKLRPTQLFAEEVAIRQAALRSIFAASGKDIGKDRPNVLGALEAPADVVRRSFENFAIDQLGVTAPKLAAPSGARLAITGSPAMTPVLPGLVGLRLTPETVKGLSKETKGTLSDLGYDPSQPIARTVEALTAERQQIHEAAQSLVPLTQKSFKTMGGTSVALTSKPMAYILSFTPGMLLDAVRPFLPERVPTSHADIEPAGIMDLLLVKQQLTGYAGAEVSHIATILKGEKKERTHRTRLETEVITLTEREVETTTERSLETTDRFEMRRESEKALQEETSVKGSASLKASYGPTVEFRASVEASWQRKSQEAEKAASETARTVTQKASEKVTERVLSRETRRITREVENIDRHGFDNTTGAGHVSGVYQWVEKVYEAQVFNYGPRTIYDLMVPEPAAMLMEAFRTRRSASLELEKPATFEITPRQLTPDNYQTYVREYLATDVAPPPQPYVTSAYDYNTGGEDKDQEFTNSTRVEVPAGYRAIRATVGQVVTVWDDWAVDVVIGQRAHRFSGGGNVWSTSLDEETGAVPFAMVTDRVGDVAIAVEVICEATNRAFDLWRADTHAKLTQAYKARLSEYEARLAELQASAPAEIQSGPSAKNRALMLDEIKRLAISTLTLQHFDAFDAIDSGSAGLPEIAFAEATTEGAYARFFEQAFEWENVSWVPYSYFWGRKEGWLDKLVIEDDDADYEAFLKAGAVRVQLPVRPGFEAAVDHFRLFGDPWMGGSLPPISDDTYLPIADELTERLGRPGDEIPVGDPWEVRVPTSLVRLRADDSLPTWSKQPDGSWVEN